MLDNGDSTLVRTPSGKNILIDTGEAENTIVEYILDRKIKTIDYMMISHFDSDHSGKVIEILDKLKVKNVIISKQSEYSQEFENAIKIVKERNVKIIQVEAGDTVKIDKDIYFDILWPENDNTIIKNPLNNNSIVAKLKYKNTSILFTGDIEEEAEKEIINKYVGNELSATILKVAHHGSNTSSSEEFIEKVQPQISLIGVGINNKFGHPNDKVIERLTIYGSKVYRTDIHGEITLKISKKGKIIVDTHL